MLSYEKVITAIGNAKAKLETLDPKTKIVLDKTLSELSIKELFAYQELKSIALLENKIDLETANLIYRSLNDWNTTNLETRIILTQLFAQFLGRR